MKKTITISIEQYECLRECLNKANEILNSLDVSGAITSLPTTSKKVQKETIKQKVKRYTELIESGKRATKPDNLKKK